MVKPSAARAPKSWQWQTATGFSLALQVASASPHEVTLVEDSLDCTFTNELPGRLIGDKTYDSDALDARLEEAWGTKIFAPNRKKQAKTQDGHPLRRYHRRWKVERWSFGCKTFAVLLYDMNFMQKTF